ncbi:MAG: succinate--CoA ligase subunit alpha, partial [Bacteroidota bacterium]
VSALGTGMAHAASRRGRGGAIISGGKCTAADKFAALEAAGAVVVKNPALIGETVKAHLAAA